MSVVFVPQVQNLEGQWEPLTSGFPLVRAADLWLQAWRRHELHIQQASRPADAIALPRTRVAALRTDRRR